MIGMIIGSTAIKNWFPDFPRGGGDFDLWSPNELCEWQELRPQDKIDLFWDNRMWDTVIPKWAAGFSTEGVNLNYATPNELYTMKVSHSSWDLANGSWKKHMWDILWLKNKGCKLLPELWEALYPIWSDLHGKKRVNLNQESGDEGEVWKPLPGAEEYMISSAGRVRGPRGAVEGSAATTGGYWQNTINRKTRLTHQLVMEAFVGPCPAGMQIRHLDGNPRNNDISNLAFGTPGDNASDKDRHGTTVRGEKHPLAKLTEDSVTEIRRLYAAGGITQRQLAGDFGVAQSLIGRVIKGQSWKEEKGFFEDAVVRIYDHDSLHRTVAHYDAPLYERVLKDGQSVAMDMKKVWALSWADQVKLFREEIYATALERWMIPSNYTFSPSRAYFLALKKTITSLTKGVSSRFIIDNFNVFKHMPVVEGGPWYMVRHMQNRDLLKPLEK